MSGLRRLVGRLAALGRRPCARARPWSGSPSRPLPPRRTACCWNAATSTATPLFPHAAGHWQALREQAARLAGLGGSLALSPHDGPRRRARPALDRGALRAAARARAPERATDLADLVRAAALDLLGDSEGAAAIAERRLRRPAGASVAWLV